MISAIRRLVFANADKNVSAPHIFLILCAYSVITSVYTLLFFGFRAMLVRLALSLMIPAVYVITERSPLDGAATAFLSPSLIMGVLIIGALYFHGDFLLFTYNCAVAIISLTYLKPKSLALYIAVSGAALAVILFLFRINLLGGAFSAVYNILYYMAAVALNILVYIFGKSYARVLQTMTGAINDANLAARAKSDFLANMSHEIRTPLNAIIGLTEAELRKASPEAAPENLRKIHASGNLLMEIINDVLDMSKIESGKFDIVPAAYDFADMIYDVVTLNMVRIGEKPVQFLVSVDETVPRRMEGDGLRIKQLLSNLLSNAFKYTRRGSVGLHVSWRAEKGGARLTFTVTDTGTGIRDEDLEKLFSEYAQVNQQSSRGIEGTGLGLVICKGLAELMDGKISVQSQYGAGSVFSAEIRQDILDETPIGPKTAAALKNFTYLPQDGGASVDYRPMPEARILVVDDVPINLEVAAACLEPYGMRVDCVGSGAAAVRRIKDAGPPYSLIFMDHMMPDMDGIEAVRAIRAIGTEYALSVPVIALTANALAGNEKMFAENGFQGFISKPIDLQRLDAVLRRWIREGQNPA